MILDFSFVNLKFLFCKIELVPVDLWIFFFKIYFTVWGYSAQLIEHVPVLGLIPIPYKTDLVASAHSLSTVEVELKESEIQGNTASLRTAWNTYDPIKNKKKKKNKNKRSHSWQRHEPMELWLVLTDVTFCMVSQRLMTVCGFTSQHQTFSRLKTPPSVLWPAGQCTVWRLKYRASLPPHFCLFSYLL